ncbi:hypothetical protein ACWGJ9_08945 [Curtobacterium citreum]
MAEVTSKQRKAAERMLHNEFRWSGDDDRAGLTALLDAVIDDGDVPAAARATGLAYEDGYLSDVARACLYAVTTDWDAAVPDAGRQRMAASPAPAEALRRIELLHEAVEITRDGRTWTQCSYEQVAWPCETRQILEEECIVPLSPPAALDPKPWAWRSVRSESGPRHDSAEGWSTFRPRVGYEQDPARYPRPFPTKVVADLVADRYDHRLHD